MMKQLTLLALIATGLVIATGTSCKKEDSKDSTTTTTTTSVAIDERDAAVGSFRGLSITSEIGSDTGSTEDSSTIIVTKGPGTSLTILTGDSITFKTSNIVSRGSGNFVGNIPVQTFIEDGVEYTLQGVGEDNEHFAFIKDTREFMYHIMITADGFVYTESFIYLIR